MGAKRKCETGSVQPEKKQRVLGDADMAETKAHLQSFRAKLTQDLQSRSVEESTCKTLAKNVAQEVWKLCGKGENKGVVTAEEALESSKMFQRFLTLYKKLQLPVHSRLANAKDILTGQLAERTITETSYAELIKAITAKVAAFDSLKALFKEREIGKDADIDIIVSEIIVMQHEKVLSEAGVRDADLKKASDVEPAARIEKIYGFVDGLPNRPKDVNWTKEALKDVDASKARKFFIRVLSDGRTFKGPMSKASSSEQAQPQFSLQNLLSRTAKAAPKPAPQKRPAVPPKGKSQLGQPRKR